MPQFASCQNEDGTTYDISDTEFRFSSNGLLSGRIERFAPTCPFDVGIGKFNVSTSSLDFLVAEDEQKVVMDMTGNLQFPIGGSDSVTANGAITLDLLTGKMIDGFVEIHEPFVWAIPNDKPVLRFNINSARIDTSGFSVNGNSQILLPDDRIEEIEFENFVFDIEKYKVKSGRVAISSDIGLKLLLTDSGLNWKVIGKDDPLTENRSAKIGIGHGQMEGKKLEELMLGFMAGDFDVLVSTTIIESGLDVPNANTIFINNANNFGLSDLHQMRGRVGRSNKKAFCYFITPPYHMMTDDARKRIEALVLFSDLGSGINIAMKDLEIRGAGDLLGGEQSGFINDIGFDTYQKILQEAIEELKENEFKELYPTDNSKPKEYVKEVTIDTDFEILFPDDYINSITERLALYNKLGTLKTEEELQVFETEIIDRFGGFPTQVEDLLDSVRIKWLAKALGLEKIILKQKRMLGYFVSDQQSDFYQTEAFSRMLKYVQQNGKSCVMKEKQTKNGLRLLITFIRIDSVKTALSILQKI